MPRPVLPGPLGPAVLAAVLVAGGLAALLGAPAALQLAGGDGLAAPATARPITVGPSAARLPLPAVQSLEELPGTTELEAGSAPEVEVRPAGDAAVARLHGAALAIVGLLSAWLGRVLVTSRAPAPPEERLALVAVAAQPRAARNVLLFGPNGSGKGTQGALIVQQYPDLAHIESGAIFRQHISSGSELGKKAKGFIDRGELVPDDITIPMVLATMKERGAHGWLLDGFPRNVVQAEKLWEALQAEGMALDFVVEILLPRAVAKERIMGRRLCAADPNHPNNVGIPAIAPAGGACRVCGEALSSRADDQDQAAIDKRHDIYYDTASGTLAAVAFYRRLAEQGKVRFLQLDGVGSIAAVKENLLKGLSDS